jgi:hypothetical protein
MRSCDLDTRKPVQGAHNAGAKLLTAGFDSELVLTEMSEPDK